MAGNNACIRESTVLTLTDLCNEIGIPKMCGNCTSDELVQAIAIQLQKHAAHLDGARKQFQFVPREGGAYPERAISHFFIRALMDAIQGTAVLEAAFPNVVTSKNDNHLDAIVFNAEVAILAEFKTAWAPIHWHYLAEDAGRVQRFAPGIAKRFRDGKQRRQFAFYGVDAWRLEIANAWENGEAYKKWTLPPVFAPMRRGIQTVWRDEPGDSKGKDYDGYYLLFAVDELFPERSEPEARIAQA